jgi:uncharacterized membrane protein
VPRYATLYVATLIVFLPLDFVFLGFVAKGLFTSQVGDMLGAVRPVPAVLFYLLYIAGIVIFVSAGRATGAASALLYGALFGLFCYATFELTAMSLLKHWTWPVVAVDIAWGMIATAIAASVGLLIADRVSPVL